MRYGVREICNIVLKAKANQKLGSHTFQKGEPVIYFETAKTSSMETASTTVYATGGRGNNRLIAWEGEKTLTFTFEEALISQEGLAVLSGADLLEAGTAGTVVAHTTEEITVGANAVIALSKAAKTSATETNMYIMLLDENGEMSGIPVHIVAGSGGNATISTSGGTSTITMTDTSLFQAGDRVLVDYYVEYTSDASQIDITPDKFAGFYYLEADTLFRREKDGVDLPAQFVLPKVKIQSNFTFTMASTGDPSTFTFTLDAFPDYIEPDGNKKVLASIQVLGADDNYDNASSVVGVETGDITRYTYNKDGGSYIARQEKTEDDED